MIKRENDLMVGLFNGMLLALPFWICAALLFFR
ncbi:hypothetical protein IJ21_40420 [Paenibacillus sp. 32O-W]|mgnify:CR=1 FL=1|jgi:hypothetical protein|nr:hypothetical protein IJ21_40420 [Paenibacillus sp. 32O-W]